MSRLSIGNVRKVSRCCCRLGGLLIMGCCCFVCFLVCSLVYVWCGCLCCLVVVCGVGGVG